MRPAHFNVDAERTADGYIAHCRELEIAGEGEETRLSAVEVGLALFGESAATF